MAPEKWAKELAAEVVMGVPDGLSRKLGFEFDDDAKIEFAKDIYPTLLDFVRRVRADAVAQKQTLTAGSDSLAPVGPDLDAAALDAAERALCEADGMDPDCFLASRQVGKEHRKRLAGAAVVAYLSAFRGREEEIVTQPADACTCDMPVTDARKPTHCHLCGRRKPAAG